METKQKQELSLYVRKMHALQVFLSQDFLGGPRQLKMSWVINSQKGLTFFFVALLMYLFDNYSTVAWVYLGLHGSYGFCWLLKHMAFPDRNWETRITWGGAVMTYLLVLGLYWVFPFLLISGLFGAPVTEPSNELLFISISLHTLGVAIMLSADSQKHFTLKYHQGLITEGMYRYVRHPNYLGEMMIYASYALLVRHWIPWAILAWVWIGIFYVNMKKKEASLSRYPGWTAYKAATGMLIPRKFF